MNARELRARKAEILGDARKVIEAAEAADRDLTEDEQRQYDLAVADAEALEKRAARLEALPENQPVDTRNQGPAHLKIGRGDSEVRALAHYIKTGDTGGVRTLLQQEDGGRPELVWNVPTAIELRATAEVMNVAAAADGGAAVPTGFAGRIAARRSEIRLAERLGVEMVPGNGTTVNFPYENADPVVFGATSEQVDALSNTYEQDRPTLATKAFTLAKKTKKIILTEELLDDEDANLMGFIADHIGRALGMTHNSLLLTEVAASGTAFKTFASATVIAVDELEPIAYNNTVSYYLDDAGSIAWVMQPAVHGEILLLDDANMRRYANNQMGNEGGPSLLGHPIYYSSQSGATSASTKSVYFGNWRFVGMREDPSLRLIRDPYTTDGVVYLKYSFRTCYGVLIAGAIGYGVHPSA
jgi:HK97 family phage major capsid protein